MQLLHHPSFHVMFDVIMRLYPFDSQLFSSPQPPLVREGQPLAGSRMRTSRSASWRLSWAAAWQDGGCSPAWDQLSQNPPYLQCSHCLASTEQSALCQSIVSVGAASKRVLRSSETLCVAGCSISTTVNSPRNEGRTAHSSAGAGSAKSTTGGVANHWRPARPEAVRLWAKNLMNAGVISWAGGEIHHTGHATGFCGDTCLHVFTRLLDLAHTGPTHGSPAKAPLGKPTLVR